MTRPIQYFTDDYLERCKGMSVDQILKALDDFKQLQSIKVEKSILISMRITPSLLNAFKTKARLEGVSYQAKIKALMRKNLGLSIADSQGAPQ